MTTRLHWTVCALVALVYSFAPPAIAEDAGPIALSAVKGMVDAGQSPQQCIEAMNERGVRFRLTTTAKRNLKSWGFDDDQLGLIGQIVRGEKLDLNPAPGDGAGEKKEYPVGYAYTQGQHAAEKRRVERAIDASTLNYKRIELSRVTLYCSEARARKLAPVLKKLEADLIKRFPDYLTNGIAPASSHIVIVDGHSEWSQWVNACFTSYEQDGIKFTFGRDGEDPRESLGKSAGYVLRDLHAIHADRQNGDEGVSRQATYAVGDLMMRRAGGKDQPDGLYTGFGNLSEAMVHKTPSVMLYSYEKRDLKQAEPWTRVVAQRLKNKVVETPSYPWGRSTDMMTPANYADCWSYVSTLAMQPEKLSAAVELMASGDKKMHEAVQEVYQLEDRQLMQAWFKFVTR